MGKMPKFIKTSLLYDLGGSFISLLWFSIKYACGICLDYQKN